MTTVHVVEFEPIDALEGGAKGFDWTKDLTEAKANFLVQMGEEGYTLRRYSVEVPDDLYQGETTQYIQDILNNGTISAPLVERESMDSDVYAGDVAQLATLGLQLLDATQMIAFLIECGREDDEAFKVVTERRQQVARAMTDLKDAFGI